MAEVRADMQWNRSLQCHAFVSWRLGNLVRATSVAHLPQPVFNVQPESSEYLQLRAAALHNHLHRCGLDLLFFGGSTDNVRLFRVPDPQNAAAGAVAEASGAQFYACTTSL